MYLIERYCKGVRTIMRLVTHRRRVDRSKPTELWGLTRTVNLTCITATRSDQARLAVNGCRRKPGYKPVGVVRGCRGVVVRPNPPAPQSHSTLSVGAAQTTTSRPVGGKGRGADDDFPTFGGIYDHFATLEGDLKTASRHNLIRGVLYVRCINCQRGRGDYLEESVTSHDQACNGDGQAIKCGVGIHPTSLVHGMT